MTEKKDNRNEGAGCGVGGCCSGPGRWIWILLVIAVAVVLIARNSARKELSTATTNPVVSATASNWTVSAKALPRLVDLGAGKCIPCKMMAPILEELKKTYAGKIDVQFIDVWEKADEAKKYGVNVIPTQIFYDSAGKELFRHEGFLGKEDILSKWKELGVDLAL